MWFSYATHKYSFFSWLAIYNRLSTGDRIKIWNSGQRVDCILCDNIEESRNHLFFSCRYSSEIWKALTHRLLGNDFSRDWDCLITSLNSSNQPWLHQFLLRYAFQSALYHIWRERNARRHGEIPSPHDRLIKLIDKNVRNRLSAIQDMGDQRYEGALRVWFAARSMV